MTGIYLYRTMQLWPLHNKSLRDYWIKVFSLYACVEACIQLMFLFILNNFSERPVSNLEFHSIMWVFQCMMVWTIWFTAQSVYEEPIWVQIFVNLFFFIAYSIFWLGPIQDSIHYLHQHLQQFTLPKENRLPSAVDSSVGYQLLKHGFRLAFFYFANFFYSYRIEEQKRLQIIIDNKELQLKLLKWHLNPRFYLETINYLKQLSYSRPADCTKPILHLAKVMEYIIYDSREKLIDVSKEIHFLHHYIELINPQHINSSRFSITTSGEYGKLKIPPLLLAGFIDSIVSGDYDSDKNKYLIELQFSNNKMLFSVNGSSDNNRSSDNNNSNRQPNESMQKRLKELYREEFSFGETGNGNVVELSLTLHEQ